MILAATTESIEAVLVAAATTTNPVYHVSYADLTVSTFVAGAFNGALNGTTSVTIVSAPAASTQRQVKYLSIFNADTVAHTVIVRHDTSGTERVMVRVALPVNSTLTWTPDAGWQLIPNAFASSFVDITTDQVITGKKSFVNANGIESTGLVGLASNFVDAGSGSGPINILFRDSSSPAASDFLGEVSFRGRDSVGGIHVYGSINGFLVDPTDGSEDGAISFGTISAGSNGTRFFIGAGAYTATATGGDQGVGTLNATAVYDDGVLICAPFNPEMSQADWDALVPEPVAVEGEPLPKKRKHRTAKRHFDMLAEGFRPGDYRAYLERLEADKALPGFITLKEARRRGLDKSNPDDKASITERLERMQLAVDYLAAAFVDYVKKHP